MKGVKFSRSMLFFLAGVLVIELATPIGILGAETTVVELGPQETVLTNGQHGLTYFPDGCIAVVHTPPLARVLFAADTETVLLTGASMMDLIPAGTALRPGAKGEFDNGYAGIGGVFHSTGGELFAVYHAEDQEGMKEIPGGIPGFYCRIGIVTSRDEGKSFTKLGPLLTPGREKNLCGGTDQGIGEPSACTSPDGRKVFVYYTSHERLAGRSVDICVAQGLMATATSPATWKKFYEGAFSEPGAGGRDTPIITGGAQGADALFPQVIYSAALKRFVMTYCIHAWGQPAKSMGASGIYVALSDDGVHWPRESMRQIWRVPTIATTGEEVAWHPTLIPDEGDAAGQLQGWLYYGYSAHWGHQPPQTPHWLARKRFKLQMARPR